MADDSITSAPVDAAETAAPTPNNSDSGSEHSKPKPWFKRLSLTTWIFIALILGVLAGLALQGSPEIADTYIKPFGTIFLNLIKMIVVPLVLFSIIAGVISWGTSRRWAPSAARPCVTTCAPPPAPSSSAWCSPTCATFGAGYTLAAGELSYEASEPRVRFIDTIVNIFPANFFQPMRRRHYAAGHRHRRGLRLRHPGRRGRRPAGRRHWCNAMSEVCIEGHAT